MGNKSVTAALAAGLLFIANHAAALASEAYPCVPRDSRSGPLKIGHAHVTVVIHQGDGNHALIVGLNQLRGPFNIHCRSQEGCLLSISAMVNTGGGTYTCTKVDGTYLRPDAPFDLGGYSSTTFQSELVALGTHSVETDIYAQNAETLGPWEVIYSLYDK